MGLRAFLGGRRRRAAEPTLQRETVVDLLCRLGSAEIEHLDKRPFHPFIHESALQIGADRRATIYAHPNSRITFRSLEIPARGVLRFGHAVDPATWEKSGDGVLFSVEVHDRATRRREAYSRYIDPKRSAQERRWLDAEIDLMPFVGSQVDVVFSTDCGPENNADFDWAHWSDPMLLLADGVQLRLLPLLSVASLWNQKVEMVREDLFLIGDDLRQVLSEHPDSVVWFRGICVPPEGRLETSIGINDTAWPRMTRGVTFKVTVRRADVNESSLFSERLDPVNNSADRAWREVRIGLDEHSGEVVDLSFQTLADPGPDRQPMWAGWDQPRITGVTSGRRPLSRGPVPNVILLTLDTVRADHLGCYGRRSARTPNLDWLASEGTLFERCFSQSNITLPSHLAILSSRYPSQHTRENSPISLAPSLTMLANLLRGRGFDTASVISAEILNPSWCRGIERGFDSYRSVNGIRRLGSHTLSLLRDWLDSRAPGPFFSWVHLFDAHAPYIPPKPYYGANFPRGGDPRTLDELALPPELDHYRRWLDPLQDLRLPISQYDAAISYLDDVVGALLAELRRRDLLDNTILAVTADHGECLGDRGVYFAHVGLHDPVTHVPMILFAPGRMKRGKRTGALAMSVDIVPTLLELLDFPPLPDAQGRSLLAAASGGATREAVFAEHSRDAQLMARTERYKYIRSTADFTYTQRFSFRTGEEEIYDLEADPGESRNLADREPGVLKDMRELMDRWLADNRRTTAAGQAAEPDEEVAEKLRSLGYF